MHHASGREIIGDGIVLRRPIVPEGDVAGPPAVAHGEFRPGDMLEQEPEQGLAFGFRQIQDAGGEAEVDEQTCSARDRVTTDDGMADRWVAQSG